MKIDIHTHILPEKLPNWTEKFGLSGMIQLEHHRPGCAQMIQDGKLFREIQSNSWDPVVRMEECSQHQVDMQVLSTAPIMFSYWAKPEQTLAISQFLNDHIGEIIGRYPDRFIGLGTIPMNHSGLAVKELERCREIGLVGVEIGSNIDGKNLNAQEFFPIYEAAEALSLCLFVHPWNMMGGSEMPEYWLPWLVGMPAEGSRAICSMIFGGVFDKFPKLRIAFAHGGGSFAGSLGRIEHGFRVRPDLCAIHNTVNPSEYLGHFWVDSLVHDPRQLHYILESFGEDRVMLGTDYPFPLGEAKPGELIGSSELSSAIKNKLLYQSALEWTGLSEEILGR